MKYKVVLLPFLLSFLSYAAVANDTLKVVKNKSRVKTSSILPLYKNSGISIEERVRDLLSRMTPEEKFWQLFMIPGDLDGVDKNRYKNGIFGLQVSAVSQGGGAQDKC